MPEPSPELEGWTRYLEEIEEVRKKAEIVIDQLDGAGEDVRRSYSMREAAAAADQLEELAGEMRAHARPGTDRTPSVRIERDQVWEWQESLESVVDLVRDPEAEDVIEFVIESIEETVPARQNRPAKENPGGI